MKVVAEVPHEHYQIKIFYFNGKYIVQIILDQYEQTFKIDEKEVSDLEDIKQMITTELLSNSLQRFLTMREDWLNSLKKINN